MLHVTKLVLVIVKQEMDLIVKNHYFKLLANNITPFTHEKFSLERIESNFKMDTLFFYFLIREISTVQKVNTANGDKNMSNTTLLVAKSREDCHFQYSQKKKQEGNVYS